MLIRTAVPGDAEAILTTTAEAFAGYRSFAPGWSPPEPESAESLAERLAGPALFWVVAETEEGALAGHAAMLPSPASRVPGPPELAHLGALFVRPPHWGTGVAVALHDRLLTHATARGFSELRLFTPAGHARARRFYEREGWRAAGPPAQSAELGLLLVEYRRPTAPG
jgi:GNAT superfamily N-acetyltransferase